MVGCCVAYQVGYLIHRVHLSRLLVDDVQFVVTHNDLQRSPVNHIVYHLKYPGIERIHRLETQVLSYFQQAVVVTAEHFAVRFMEVPYLPLCAFNQFEGGEHFLILHVLDGCIIDSLVGAYQQIPFPKGRRIDGFCIVAESEVIAQAVGVAQIRYAPVHGCPDIVVVVLEERQHGIVGQRIVGVVVVDDLPLYVYFIDSAKLGA